MRRAHFAAVAAAGTLLAALYLAPIHRRGLVGPDEPRYASVGRQMAESGDWITPTLWGEPWFEKPVLVYWLGAAGHSLGLDASTRWPVALLSLGFLAYFFRRVGKQFGNEAAAAATCILATSAGWVAYSDAGVFDAPLVAFTSAALLNLLDWTRVSGTDPAPGPLPWFGFWLALGVLSKGLVAPLIALLAALPVLWKSPRRALDLLHPGTLLPFALVCLPWYAACYARHGRAFVDEFLLRHHVERFFTSSLEHVQPWWFFAPVLAAFLLPWTPLLFGLRRRDLRGDPRIGFLCAWALGPLVFFSLAVNKVPGYILPMLPPTAILLALQWQRRPARKLFLASVGSLLLVSLAHALLPRALSDGITRAWAEVNLSEFGIVGILAAALAVLLVAASAKLGGAWPIAVLALGSAATLGLLKFATYPAISRAAGVREFYLANRDRAAQACLGDVRRHVAYGLRHYSRDGIPECSAQPRRLRIEGDPPRFALGRREPGPEESPAPNASRVRPSLRRERSSAAAGAPARGARSAYRPD